MARGRRGGSPAAARGPPDPRRALLRPRARPPRAAGGRSGGDQSPFVANRRGRRVLPVTGPSSREPTVAAPPWLVHRGERHVLESISLSFLKSQAHGDKLQGDGRVRCEVRCWSSLRSTQNGRTHFSATPGSLARRCSAGGFCSQRPAFPACEATTRGPAPSPCASEAPGCVAMLTRPLPHPRLSSGPQEQAVLGGRADGPGPSSRSLGRLLWEAANLPLSRRTWSRHCALLIVTVYTDPESSLWMWRTSARSPAPDRTGVLRRPHTRRGPFCSEKGPSDRAIKKYDLFTKQPVQKPGPSLPGGCLHNEAITSAPVVGGGRPLIRKLTTARQEEGAGRVASSVRVRGTVPRLPVPAPDAGAFRVGRRAVRTCWRLNLRPK